MATITDYAPLQHMWRFILVKKSQEGGGKDNYYRYP